MARYCQFDVSPAYYFDSDLLGFILTTFVVFNILNIKFQVRLELFPRDIPAATVTSYVQLRPKWFNTRECILERNLTVVRSVENRSQRKAT